MANLKDVARSVEQRSKHKRARGTIDLALPVFDGQYAGRFGVHDPERIASFEAVVERAPEDVSPADRLDLNAGFIADACRRILGKPIPGAPWEPLTHDDGRPVRFDEDFAEALGLEPPPGREGFTGMHDVVLACFTVEEDDGTATINPAALNTFSVRLLTWMQDTTRALEGELVGEVNGSRP